MAKTTAVATVQNRDGLRAFLAQLKPQVGDVISKRVTPERILKIASLAASRQPLLYECTKQSLAIAIMDCASLGLEPNGFQGGAYLVPFMNNKLGARECTLIVGYRGLELLAQRSGKIEAIETVLVHAKDHFKFWRTMDGPQLEHTPYRLKDAKDERGDITDTYAIAYRPSGGRSTLELMGIGEVEKIRERSRAKNSGPWVTDYGEMVRKTVSRRLCKHLPMAEEADHLHEMEARDNPFGSDAGRTIDVDFAEHAETAEQSFKAKIAEKAEATKTAESDKAPRKPRSDKGRPRKPKATPPAAGQPPQKAAETPTKTFFNGSTFTDDTGEATSDAFDFGPAPMDDAGAREAFDPRQPKDEPGL